MNRDFGGAAGARQADLGLPVRANDGRVDVAMAIDLRAAEETDFDPTVLEEQLKHIRHAAHHQRARDERRIADRHRQALRYRADRARFIDQHEVGRMGAQRQIACEVR